jgi:transposase
MRYIGCDAHIASCTFHVIDGEGKSLDWRTMETNGAKLVSYLREIPGEKKLVIEETNLSRWLHSLLSREVDELVVCNPVRNRLLAQGPKTDRVDAQKLAQLLRGGFLQPVFHQGDSREELRDLVSGYQDLIQDFVRLKNRYKALFRSQGIQKRGQSVYEDGNFLKDLGKGPKHFVGEKVFERIQAMEAQRTLYVQEMKRQEKKFPEIRFLKTIPGIKTIQACKIVATVVSPERFPNKYKFFSYCGLVKHACESDGRNYGKRKGWGNPVLKGVFRTAGQTVLRGSSSLRKDYDRMLTKGISHYSAYNATCRKIASLVLAVWKKKEKYKNELNKAHQKIQPQGK